jgi:hypothetical protein
LNAPEASLLHAAVRWTGLVWELRDHSRNGVLVDNQRLPAAGAMALKVGAVIAFCDHGQSDWIVEDLARPSSVLWPLSADTPVIGLSPQNALPSIAEREVSIHMAPDGQWFCEQGGLTRLLRDGDEVRMGGKAWCFLSGAAVEETLDRASGTGLRSGDLLLHFHVSLDEEHVSLQVAGPQHTISLGERAHHYCLLTLLRRRLRDAERGLDSDAQGWVEVEALARMLGVDVSHVNIQIFRARRQMTQAMPAANLLPAILERRRGAVRFGHWRARIVRGSTLEGVFHPFSHDGGDPVRPDAQVERD